MTETLHIKRLAPVVPHRKPLLPLVPKPEPTPIQELEAAVNIPSKEQSSDAGAQTVLANDLLLSPSEPAFVDPEFVEPAASAPFTTTSAHTTTSTKPTKSTASETANTFLTASLQTQEELSNQLAQMAKQLKLNAIHFTNSLEKDRGVVENAEEKLEGNLTRLKSSRGKLLEFSGKSGKTTWLVLGAMIVVVIGWILMFLVIRIT